MREQSVIQLDKHALLVKLLARAAAKERHWEDELPITSVRKEKSGVLSMVSRRRLCICVSEHMYASQAVSHVTCCQ